MLVAVALLAATGWESLRYYQALRETEALDVEITRLEGEIAQRKAAQAAAAASAAAAAQAARDPVIERIKRFDWNAMFASVHSARVPGVRLTSLDVSAREGTVVLDLTAGSTEQVITYLVALNEGEPRPKWNLVRMQATATGAVGTIRSAKGAFGESQ